MYNHLEEGDGPGEEHPDVNHLDVGGDRQVLREPKKTKKVTISFTKKKFLVLTLSPTPIEW